MTTFGKDLSLAPFIMEEHIFTELFSFEAGRRPPLYFTLPVFEGSEPVLLKN